MAETLKRRIGLPLLTAYGVGVMVGAGIYVSIRAMLLIGAAVVRGCDITSGCSGGSICIRLTDAGVFTSDSVVETIKAPIAGGTVSQVGPHIPAGCRSYKRLNSQTSA